MNQDRPNDPSVKPQDSDASPYGPQHGHIDEAAGGADSSPFDNMSSEEREAALRAAREQDQDRLPQESDNHI